MNPVLIVLPILSVLMFDLGLSLRMADFAALLRRPRAMILGLAGQVLALPALAFMLIHLFDPDPVMATGLVLIACSPGGSSSNVFSALARGDVALSVSLTACSSIITLVTLPLFMMHLASEDLTYDIPITSLIMQNLVLVLLPVVLGMMLRYSRTALAMKLHNVLKRLALPALLLLAAVFFAVHYSTIMSSLPLVGPLVFALLVLAMMAGSLLAALGGLDYKRRRTLVIEVGMQNSAQAIALAASPLVFANDDMAVPAIVYALFMNLVLLCYVGVCRAYTRHEAEEVEQ